MLGTMTPLGERTRNSRWGTTAAAFALGSLLAGAGFGVILGALGGALHIVLAGQLDRLAPTLLLVAVATGLLFDTGILHRSLPSTRRQVNDLWVNAYRGWAYGLGFGLQLGLGVVTIVKSSSVYAAFIAATLTASPFRGAIIGGLFGLLRGGSILYVWRVQRPHKLRAVAQTLSRWEPLASYSGVAITAAVFVALGIGLLT